MGLNAGPYKKKGTVAQIEKELGPQKKGIIF